MRALFPDRQPYAHDSIATPCRRTHMIPKTPVGPTACCSALVPPHAAADRDSKKYVQSSSLAPTKPNEVSAVSRVGSQRREMMVDFRRRGFFSPLFFLSSCLPSLSSPLLSSSSSSSSSSSPSSFPCLPPFFFLSSSSGSSISSRRRLLEVLPHGEPLV